MHCLNTEMVEATPLETEEDELTILRLLENHIRFTSSDLAQRIVNEWKRSRKEFMKVLSPEYRRVLESRGEQEKEAVYG